MCSPPQTDGLIQTVTRYIVGYKNEESDLLLKFLYQHIAMGSDFHIRVKWHAKSVIAWDVSKAPFLFVHKLTF